MQNYSACKEFIDQRSMKALNLTMLDIFMYYTPPQLIIQLTNKIVFTLAGKIVNSVAPDQLAP